MKRTLFILALFGFAAFGAEKQKDEKDVKPTRAPASSKKPPVEVGQQAIMVDDVDEVEIPLETQQKPSQKTNPPVVAKEEPTKKEPDTSLDPLVDKLLEEQSPVVVATPLVTVGGRLDASYSSGSAIYQGFLIPSFRLAAWGAPSDQVQYSFALGQSREFTTVLLPQLIPTEAFVIVSSADINEKARAQRLQIKMGLFTPSFLPWWSPDLKDIPLPSYHSTHAEMFLNRDTGAELQLFTKDNTFEAAAGIFNGNGIIGLNSNNSKAFNLMLRLNIPAGAERKFTLGASGYGLIQSTEGSVNYKNHWGASLYALYTSPGLWACAEYMRGGFLEDGASAYSEGAAAAAVLTIEDTFALFFRAEYLLNPFRGTVTDMKGFQVGPVLTIDKILKIFTTYAYQEDKLGRISNTAEIRLRLNI